jgi:aminocarboxymuconate-semialdehyde decarboxylase
MSVIDVHTHMLSEDYLKLLVRHGEKYTVESVSDSRVLHRGGASFLTLTPGMFDYDQRIAAMDKAGVDVSVVSLSCPNVFWGDRDASLAAALLTNDQMADAQRAYGGRVRFLASLPWQHRDAAIAELDRALGLGAVGVMVLANIDGASLTDPAFAGVWAAIDDRSLPVLVHPTTPPGVEAMDMTRYHLSWSVGFTFDTTLALARMILDGFFD